MADGAFASHAFRQFDLRCTGCGYGAAASKEPPCCPMCGGTTWDFELWRSILGHPPHRRPSTQKRPRADAVAAGAPAVGPEDPDRSSKRFSVAIGGHASKRG